MSTEIFEVDIFKKQKISNFNGRDGREYEESHVCEEVTGGRGDMDYKLVSLKTYPWPV